MKILVTNDDGIFARGLWTLVGELRKIGEVVVVAPDREQSAIGTAVSLHQPLRAQKVKPVVPEIETYAVEGTPSDSVILALGKLVKDRIDLVVSGINYGANLGDDVLISGTVGAALQAYLRGFPTLAMSVEIADSPQFDGAAKLAALLAKRIDANVLPGNIFLNVNLPNLPLAKIKGIKITRLGRGSHTNTVDEGHDGRREYYWLIRQKVNNDPGEKTDVWAIEQGNISITPLHTNLSDKPSSLIPNSVCSKLLRELRQSI